MAYDHSAPIKMPDTVEEFKKMHPVAQHHLGRFLGGLLAMGGNHFKDFTGVEPVQFQQQILPELQKHEGPSVMPDQINPPSDAQTPPSPQAPAPAPAAPQAATSSPSPQGLLTGASPQQPAPSQPQESDQPKKFKIDTRSGTRIELPPNKQVAPGPFDVIVAQTDKGEEITDVGSRAKDYLS